MATKTNTVQLARQLRREQTPAEQKLWSALRDRQLDGCKFKRQVPLGNFVVDFSCYEKRLIIELDGGHHSEQEVYDQIRTEYLESLGYKVIRFWNNEVIHNFDAVLSEIFNELTNSTSP